MGQAAEQGHSLSTEIKVLVLHGLLHLAGFDHEVDDGRMARREKALRVQLGLPLGLIERAGVAGPSRGKATAGPSTTLRSAQDDRKDGGKIPSGAKARVRSGSVNVRAKARTLHLMSRYAGAKAQRLSEPRLARLKSCPFKAPKNMGRVELKPCPFKTATTTEPAAKAGRV
jgi:hypothetical protein